MNLKNIVEALLFAADKPLSLVKIQTIFADEDGQCPEKTSIQAVISDIADDYRDRPVQLQQVASGYRFQVKEELSPWITRLLEERPPRYSRALLETLSIIAYQQPTTRSEIEAIRGVSVNTQIIKTLVERDWIKIIGYKEVPGKPALYATTRPFLDYFNLKSLTELPTLKELHSEPSIEPCSPSAENLPESTNLQQHQNSTTHHEQNKSPSIIQK